MPACDMSLEVEFYEESENVIKNDVQRTVFEKIAFFPFGPLTPLFENKVLLNRNLQENR